LPGPKANQHLIAHTEPKSPERDKPEEVVAMVAMVAMVAAGLVLAGVEWTLALIKQICLPTLGLLCVVGSSARPHPSKQRVSQELWQHEKVKPLLGFQYLLAISPPSLLADLINIKRICQRADTFPLANP